MPEATTHTHHKHHKHHADQSAQLPTLQPKLGGGAAQSAGEPKTGKDAVKRSSENQEKTAKAVAKTHHQHATKKKTTEEPPKTTAKAVSDPAKSESKPGDIVKAEAKLKTETGKNSGGKTAPTEKKHHKKHKHLSKEERKRQEEEKAALEAAERKKAEEEARRKWIEQRNASMKALAERTNFEIDRAHYNKKAHKWRRSTSARILSKMRSDPASFSEPSMLTDVGEYHSTAHRGKARKGGRKTMDLNEKAQDLLSGPADVANNIMGAISSKLEDVVDDQNNAFLERLAKAESAPDYKEKKALFEAGKGPDPTPQKQVSAEETHLENLGISTAVISGIISGAMEIGKLVKDCIDFANKCKMGHITAEEGFEFGKTTLTHLVTLAASINGMVAPFAVAGSVTAAAVPIVGNAFGIVTGVSSLVTNVKAVIKGRKYARRMKLRQGMLEHGLTRDFLRDQRGDGDAGTAVLKELGKLKRIKSKDSFDRNAFTLGSSDMVTDQWANKQRKIRTDESILKMRQSLATPHGTRAKKKKEKVDKVLERVEEMDMVGELMRANELREREGLIQAIAVDGLGIASNIAGLVPGAGTMINASISASVGGIMLGRKGTLAVRDHMRKHGYGKADMNKSQENKKVRRGRLARALYMKFYRFNQQYAEDPSTIPEQFPGTGPSPENKEKFKHYNEMFYDLKTLNTLVHATGQPGVIERSVNMVDMIGNMKKGFYRDNG